MLFYEYFEIIIYNNVIDGEIPLDVGGAADHKLGHPPRRHTTFAALLTLRALGVGSVGAVVGLVGLQRAHGREADAARLAPEGDCCNKGHGQSQSATESESESEQQWHCSATSGTSG